MAGGGSAVVAASIYRGGRDESSVTKEVAEFQSQSKLLDLQTRLESDYLSRLSGTVGVW